VINKAVETASKAHTNDDSPFDNATANFRLIEINGVAEIHPSVSLDQFSDMFIEFIESHGWFFGGGYKDITNEEKEETGAFD